MMLIRRLRLYFHTVAIVTLMMAFMAGCTHNNGDIGPLFGSWTLQEIIIDGTPDEDYGHNMTWNFQNHNLSIMTVLPHHDRAENMGTWDWVETDRMMSIDFTYKNSDGVVGGSPFCPPDGLHLPTGQVLIMDVEQLTSSDMTLLYESHDGSLIKYVFTKLK